MSTTKPTEAALELLAMDVDHALGKAFNMLFVVWRIETTLTAHQHAVELAKRLCTAFPGGIGVCHFVEIDAVAPSAEARASFIDMLRLPAMRHYSVTHEGIGFKAAAVRAIVTTQHSLARPKCEHAVHNAIENAARWHEGQQRTLQRQETAVMIADCVHSLRAAHRQKFP